MAGICGFSVKRSSCCHLPLACIKIEPDHFPEGKKLRCLARGLGPAAGMWTLVGAGGCGMKSKGHQPRLLCSALPNLKANHHLCETLPARFCLNCFFIFCTGWSSKTSFTRARASSSSPSPSTASWMEGSRTEISRLLFIY